MLNNLDRDINQLLSWIEKNGFSGWDPYDVQGSDFYTNYLIGKNIFVKVFRKIFDRFSFIFPMFTRKLLNIKPKINAKTMALLSLSYIKLYALTNEKKYYNDFNECLKWLFENNHSIKKGTLGWGYPFDWHSLIFIPKETPLCVPTVLVGHALLDDYILTKNEQYLEQIHQIKNFLSKELNITYVNENSICFSYSPIDDYMVINANLYTASFLTRFGVLFNDSEILALARKSRYFAISQQEKDGSWPYWSYLYKIKIPKLVDNYHTGIKLQWLQVCNSIDFMQEEQEAIVNGTTYYYKHLFMDNGLPKISDSSEYPVDIHGSAQAFVTFNTLKEWTDKTLIEKVYCFTRTKMRNKSQGYFYYRIYKKGPFTFTSKIPYMRWSQAWMLYGLVNLLEYRKLK